MKCLSLYAEQLFTASRNRCQMFVTSLDHGLIKELKHERQCGLTKEIRYLYVLEMKTIYTCIMVVVCQRVSNRSGDLWYVQKI